MANKIGWYPPKPKTVMGIEIILMLITLVVIHDLLFLIITEVCLGSMLWMMYRGEKLLKD